MGLVHDLLNGHTKINRSVTNLPDGIRTVTESDDSGVAQAIKAHVASMSSRLKDGREFNIFSTTLPMIFDNADKIKPIVELSDKARLSPGPRPIPRSWRRHKHTPARSPSSYRKVKSRCGAA